MSNILIIHGAGRLSEIVASFAPSQYSTILRYVDESFLTTNKSATQSSLPIIHNISELNLPDSPAYISSIGYKNMQSRKDAFLKILAENQSIQPVNIIHDNAFVSHESIIGTGNIIFPGVVIEPGASIGNNNIFWSNCTICHDAIIGSHNFLASSSVVGGYSRIGDSCFLGFGSIINDNLNIANKTFLASGTTVIKNQPLVGVAMCGVPARMM